MMEQTKPAADCEIAFLLPVSGFVRARYLGAYSFHQGELRIGEEWSLPVTRASLERGVSGEFEGCEVRVHLHDDGDGEQLRWLVDGVRAVREDRLAAPSARSTWIHGVIGLCASAAGFAAGGLYLQKAELMASPWAAKMGFHTAAWHLLLVFALFPASVWGQRAGIRAVQVVSAVFFMIHLGIALSNGFWPDAGSTTDVWIAALNAASGALFLASLLYGQRAYRDMDPRNALQACSPSQ